MAIYGDLLGNYALLNIVSSFRAFLVSSGFIWIIWVAVATFALLFVGGIKSSLKEFNPGKALFSIVWLFAAGVASYIAVGSAIAMILPVVAGLAVVSFTRKAETKEIKAGVPERAQTAAVAREEVAEVEEEKEEEVEEAETAKEEELTEFAIKEEYTKAQLMQATRSRVEALKVAGYDALDQQYKVPVVSVLLGLLSKLLALVQQEDQNAAEVFSLEKQKTKMDSMKKNRESAEENMDVLVSRLENAVKKFERIDLRTEGTRTKDTMRQVLNIDQQVTGFVNAQRGLQKASEQEEKLELRMQKLSASSLQKFKALVDRSLAETKRFYAEVQKKIPPQQVAAEYNKVDTYFVESDQLSVAHQEAMEKDIMADETALTEKAKDLQIGERTQLLLVDREKLMMRVAAIKNNIQAEQQAAQTAAKMQQELNMSAELTRKVQENIKRDILELQKAKQEEAQASGMAAFMGSMPAR